MSTALLAAIAVILCILFRILNVNSQAHKPVLFCKDHGFLETILKIAPLLQDPYMPTRLWGFSGHVQTIIHSIIGRVRCPWPIGERCYLDLKDGTTLTYDLYEPLDTPYEDDFTLAICPGIGNTSESVYIRTFVHYAQCHGYRCAVLNHVGALQSVPVTAPRIFTYGHTADYDEMIQHILERHSNTRIVCIGFSLGGNIITKYLGEPDHKPNPQIVGGISICQGYCAIESTKWLLNWQNFRRFYLYVMTESMKNIILRHRHSLLNDDVIGRYQLNEHEIISAATLPELDEAYTRKVHNFTSVTEMYQWSSCINYLNHIRLPMIFINARDDPLVPEQLLVPIKDFAANNNRVLYLELAHGGHLGFYEGGLVYPNPVTWLDRALVALVGSLALVHADSLLKKSSIGNEDSEEDLPENAAAYESAHSLVPEKHTSQSDTSEIMSDASSFMGILPTLCNVSAANAASLMRSRSETFDVSESVNSSVCVSDSTERISVMESIESITLSTSLAQASLVGSWCAIPDSDTDGNEVDANSSTDSKEEVDDSPNAPSLRHRPCVSSSNVDATATSSL